MKTTGQRVLEEWIGASAFWRLQSSSEVLDSDAALSLASAAQLVIAERVMRLEQTRPAVGPFEDGILSAIRAGARHRGLGLLLSSLSEAPRRRTWAESAWSDKSRTGCRLFLLYEVNNRGMSDSLNAVARCHLARTGERAIGGYFYGAVRNQMDSRAVEPVSLLPRAMAEVREDKSLIRQAQEIAASELYRLGELLIEAGMPRPRTLIPSLFFRSVSAIARSVLRCCDDMSAHHILLASDVHPVGRRVAALASSSRRKIATTQHGAPLLRFGYLPTVSHRFYAWGSTSVRVLASWGLTDSSRIVAAGNPRLATVPLLGGRSEGRPTILITLQPHPTAVTEAFLRAVARSLGEIAVTTVVRPHPSQRDLRAITRSVPGARISSGALERDIAEATLVVTGTSTTAWDALAAGVKSIIFDPLKDYDFCTDPLAIDGLPSLVYADSTSALSAAVRREIEGASETAKLTPSSGDEASSVFAARGRDAAGAILDDLFSNRGGSLLRI